ncbi:MAG: hypothetical protein KAS96_11155 [Planctomycetes bacterium]|nr:hypothetical protein [Planctomycetota bacterium]
MNNELKKIKDSFNDNIQKIKKLMSLDEIIVDFSLLALHKAKKAEEKWDCDKHPSYNISNEINQIKNIRENESLKPSYQIMLNQCVVLLVSYFSSAVEDIFKESFKYKIKNGELDELGKEEIKITIDQFIFGEIEDMFVAKKDISFQDMQSIRRSFKEYIGVSEKDRERDKDVDNIVFGQACRNCIVHAGGFMNSKTFGQIKTAKNRTIKTQIRLTDNILFEEDEVNAVKDSMVAFINNLVVKVCKALEVENADKEADL